MVFATWLVIAASTSDDHHAGHAAWTMVGYISGFIALFILSGLGNGAVYKMIPTLFEARTQPVDLANAGRHSSRVISGVVIGFVAGLGSLGGVGINAGATTVLSEHRLGNLGVLALHVLLRFCRTRDLDLLRPRSRHEAPV